MKNSNHEIKTIVLRKKVHETSAHEMIEQKKSSVFRSLLKKPRKEDIHIHSVKLNYEALLMISGKYAADYFRKVTHTIAVSYNVKEVVLDKGVFPIREKSSFSKAFSSKRSKNKIDLELEEHVFIEDEDQLVFDHHGSEIRFPFKLNAKTIENYPLKVLENNETNVKKPEITYDAAIDKLKTKLSRPMEPDVRDLNDEFTIGEIKEIYTPIYEARLIGPKKKVGILRLDAVRKKFL